MCQEGCLKKQFKPRQKKTGPYQRTNAYTLPVACQQILTLVLFLTQLALYCIFVVPVLDDISHVVLWILLAFTFGLLLATAFDYMYLTLSDPVDPLVIDQQLAHRFRPQSLTFCIICDRHVHINSHHCFKCDRCVAQFDHHCKFLNNCIGGQNYQSFFRLLCINTLYNLLILAQAVWVLIRNFQDTSIAFKGNQAGIIVLIVVTIILMLAVTILLGFHCYISLCENITTYGFNHPDAPRDKNQDKISEGPPRISINLIEQSPKQQIQPPASASRLNPDGRVLV